MRSPFKAENSSLLSFSIIAVRAESRQYSPFRRPLSAIYPQPACGRKITKAFFFEFIRMKSKIQINRQKYFFVYYFILAVRP
jgi:hypothetical protein